MIRIGRYLHPVFCTAFALLWLILLLSPPPRVLHVSPEVCICDWEDGPAEETYYTAYRDLAEVTIGGSVILERDGKRGTVRTGEGYRLAFDALDTGGLAELLTVDIAGVTRLERAALFRRFSGRLWFAEEWFAWTGSAVVRTEPVQAEEVVLLAGSVTANRLNKVGATSLFLRNGVEFSHRTLQGTSVSRVQAEPPFRADECAVYLETAGGVRLVSGIPVSRELTVGDADFADEGALLPCGEVVSLDLPFAGSAKNSAGTAYRGELAHLFSTGEEYRVPSTLKRVKVRGGSLVSHAFYRCSGLKEIDACGVDPAKIEKDAFLDCTELLSLHTPRADVTLRGTYTARVLACGCTLYERCEP